MMTMTLTSKKHAATNAAAMMTTGSTRRSCSTERPMVYTTSQITAATPADMPAMAMLTMGLERKAA